MSVLKRLTIDFESNCTADSTNTTGIHEPQANTLRWWIQ
jgi:hypothetical protein